MSSKISLIAAIGQNRELGRGKALLWPVPDDLKRFKRLTMGHPVVMGRKTFESIGRPLPGRTNIVITRDAAWAPAVADGSVLAGRSLSEALEEGRRSPGGDEVFIIGGAQIYEQALPLADKLYLTLIEASTPDADAYFPAYEDRFKKMLMHEHHEHGDLQYSWVELEK